jgi:NTP pyrophosphatase (non-canonical NTP hydrolase)
MEKDLKISELKQMQFELYEKNKERWNDMEPNAAKMHLLYMVEEMGECISIIKKKGIDKVMNDEGVRGRFTEEIADVLMYYTEVLNRLDISAEELSNAYIKKHEINLNRNYVEENKKKYNN